MQKAVLLHNPESGGRGARREKELQSALAILQKGGVAATLIPTQSPGDAGAQARQAIASGCDTVFACGGDGTIHNIVQVLANTPVALAILPMGTANALAHDIGLPMNVEAAAKAALTGSTRRVGVGRIQFADLEGRPCSRLFVVAAGAGVDAHLFYKLRTGTKRRMGMTAYYAKAWQLWFSHLMVRFSLEFEEGNAGQTRTAEVTELLAVRIRNFGGVLRELAPGASLERNDLRLVYCATESRLAYLAYVTRGLLGGKWNVRGIDLAFSERVSCKYSSANENGAQSKIYVEADGELVGMLPAEITVMRDALTLLVPAP